MTPRDSSKVQWEVLVLLRRDKSTLWASFILLCWSIGCMFVCLRGCLGWPWTVAQDGHQFPMFSSRPPKGWDCRCVSPHLLLLCVAFKWVVVALKSPQYQMPLATIRILFKLCHSKMEIHNNIEKSKGCTCFCLSQYNKSIWLLNLKHCRVDCFSSNC